MSEKILSTLLFPLFIVLLGVQDAYVLNCYICAEGGLEEFGECKTSFPFSCDGYAKRFPNNEKVFCRTTRHKTFNGSYTVVKECIADSAHHATFPRKSHELEEECDVLDLNGFEVAYCICRSDDLCNDPPIVDQFAAFEEKYPELFDPEPTDTPDSQPSSPASKPIEQDEEEPENSAELSTNSFASMTPSPTRRPLVDGQVHLPADGGGVQLRSDGTSTTEENPFLAPMSETMMGPNGGAEPLSEGEEEEGTKGTTNIGAFVTVPIRTTAITAEQKLPTSSWPGTGTHLGILPELRCMQCSESDLPDANSDCRNQVMVSCPDQSKVEPGIGRPLCFSRHVINTRSNQHGVEKMCATERAILNEFGSRAVSMLNGAINEDVSCIEQQPANAGASAQRVCICTSAMCNRQSVAQQIGEPNSASSKPTTFSTQTSFEASTETPQIFKEHIIKPPTQQQVEPLNCAVCLDVNLRDPQADCPSASSQNCANQIRDEQAYCLTRQTQNGKDSFIVEKSCVSKHQFYQQFPEELQKHSYNKVPLGCATTYDGYINYCICDGQMCNRNSMAQQADSIGRSYNATNIIVNKTPKTQLTSSATKSGEHGAKLTNGPQSSQENGISTTKKSSKSSNEWIQNDHNDDSDQDSAFKINKHPLPSDGIKDKSLDHHDDHVHTSTSIPSTTTMSSATRERLEKWKQNSQPKKPVELDEFETDRSCRNCIGMIGIIAILISIIILLH